MLFELLSNQNVLDGVTQTQQRRCNQDRLQQSLEIGNQILLEKESASTYHRVFVILKTVGDLKPISVKERGGSSKLSA